MEYKWLKIPAKTIRAKIICDYVMNSVPGIYKGIVCFSSGNASAAIQDYINVTYNRKIPSYNHYPIPFLSIGEGGQLSPNNWWTEADIKIHFPRHFDATSGHLPMHLMDYISNAIKRYVVELPDKCGVADTDKRGIDCNFLIPSGSGETLLLLKRAFPGLLFSAVYNIDPHTKYNSRARLNWLVKLAADQIYKCPNEAFLKIKETG